MAGEINYLAPKPAWENFFKSLKSEISNLKLICSTVYFQLFNCLAWLCPTGYLSVAFPINKKLDYLPNYMYIVHMKELEFIWDNRKNKANAGKHSVTFEEAKTAFYDEYAVVFFDPDHSDDEDRFILLGISFKLRVIVVCHCFRESQKLIRIISARKADKAEESDYWTRRS